MADRLKPLHEIRDRAECDLKLFEQFQVDVVTGIPERFRSNHATLLRHLEGVITAAKAMIDEYEHDQK